MEDRDIAAPSVERQARAYLALEAARLALADAAAELRRAEQVRLRPRDPLTTIIDGAAITSYRTGTSETPFIYTVSRVVA